MTFMQWSNELSVGLGSVDEQHQWLVDATNRLHDELSRPEIDRGVIAELFEGLMDYTMNHFIMEEELFQRHEYPDAEIHKAMHNHFTQTIMDAMMRFEDGEDVGTDVLELLKNWLVKHIMVVDKQYVPFMAERGVN